MHRNGLRGADQVCGFAPANREVIEMVDIEHRVETTAMPTDYEHRFTDSEIAAGRHRNFIGGMWDSHGSQQLKFLVARGLEPRHRFIDVGAGPFRAGRHLIDYLDPGNYYAIDANLSLLQSGYEIELNDEQRNRLPVTNLRANDRFDTDFGVQFDMAIAQSLFTHLSLNHLQLCLFRLAKTMRAGGRFYVTFFEAGSSTPLDSVRELKGGRPMLRERDVFWYYRSDMKWAARGLPWTYRYIGDWGHPRDQRMVEYTRTDASAGPTAPTLAYRIRRWLADHIAPE